MKTRIFTIIAALAISATFALSAITARAACTCGRGCVCGSSRSASCTKCPASPIAPTADIPAGYPLKTCIVSGKPLDASTSRIVYTCKRSGQPDRVVVLYDAKSLAAFKKAPAKYLAILDAASAKQ